MLLEVAMTHEQKILWMQHYCGEIGAILMLEGEIGFGRECVSIQRNETSPDYEWYDDDYDEISGNGEVWTPEDAYHKHPCVAVLGRGKDAEEQLYQWLNWFNENNFKLESGSVEGVTDPVRIMLGQHQYHRMVKQK